MTAVSVVVPTRNRSRLLATTLRSVLWQRDVDLEVIVVDDASSDDTAAVVASFVDRRVTHVVHPTAQGPSVARNRGAVQARGAWIGFVDDDDVWAPVKVARQVTAAEELGRPWSYSGAVNVGAGLRIVSGGPPPTPDEVLAALPAYNPIPAGGSNVIVRREVFEAVGGFDEVLPPCEDWELWIRLAACGPPAAVAEPLTGYRLHAASSSLDTGRIMRAARGIEEKHATTIDWGRMHRWLGESCLRMEQHTRAVSHLARAAVHGQARGVAADLAAILRRRVGRGQLGDTSPSEDWFAHARPWLQALQATDPEDATR